MTSRILYDLINPSDAVTFYASSIEAAALATLLVGDGWYAAHALEHGSSDLDVPVLGQNMGSWLAERCEGASLEALLSEHKAEIADALASFCTGSADDRRLYENALEAIDDPEKRAAFVADWDDKHRSSLNQITNQAHAVAEKLRENSP